MTLTSVDLAICARWIIPVLPRESVFHECALLVNDGIIVDIVPQKDLTKRYDPDERIHLDSHALIPGLVNAHGHAAMSLFKGYADDMALNVWLEEHIWPAEGKWVSDTFVKEGTELAVAEMLLSGTTCYADMYYFPEISAQVAHESGMRAQIAFPILDFPTVWGNGPDEYFEKGLKLHDAYRSHERIHIAFGPHAPYTVSDESLIKVATLAEELQAPVQIHLHETAFEVESALAEHQERPSVRLNRLGVLSPLTQCVHMTQVSDEDIQVLRSSGAQVIHCPGSNMKLASGICPVAKLRSEGVNVALGTDSAASNNDLSLFAEMHQAALLAKVESGRADVLNAYEALEMATLAGARALNIDGITGSLESGKAADICAIDLSDLRHQPVHNVISQIVYSDVSQSVSHVWINGKILVKDGSLTTLSAAKIRQNTHSWGEKLRHE